MTMKKIKLSDRNKIACCFVIGILLIVVSYFLIFTKMHDQTVELDAENEQLQTEVTTLQQKEANKDQVVSETAKMRSATKKILAKYPSQCKTEDAIYVLNKLEKKYHNDFSISDEAFTMNQLLGTDGTVTSLDQAATQAGTASTSSSDSSSTASASPAPSASTAPTEAPASAATESPEMAGQNMLNAVASGDYMPTRSDITITTQLHEKTLYSINSFINKNKNRMNISNISITKEQGKKSLTCSMVVSMYAIYGNGNKYKEPDLKEVKSGRNNLFGK